MCLLLTLNMVLLFVAMHKHFIYSAATIFIDFSALMDWHNVNRIAFSLHIKSIRVKITDANFTGDCSTKLVCSACV